MEKLIPATPRPQMPNVAVSCMTCKAFVVKKRPEGLKPVGGRGQLGRCHRNPPTNTCFPEVYGSDWCLEHTS